VSAPDRVVESPDGTTIAVFESGGAQGARPLLLVHGTTADHLTFRVVGPILGRRRRLYAIDRRGRGASGDAPSGYSIAREFEDVAAVADAVAREFGVAVDVLGHSFGGRCALGASRLTSTIRRVVSYEGGPGPSDRPYQRAGLADRLRASLANGDREAVLEAFMREVVGMDDADMDRFRTDPVWPLRVAASATILRELEAEQALEASLDALCHVEVPVLQVLGSESPPAFQAATIALDACLARGAITRIQGAAHAAHHTHPGAFVAAVEAFLDADTAAGRAQWSG